ncbi:hypothetical protein PROPEN_01323 [Proteus penneri ATCC 35198]|nr:hypothetical protein PROPEN_01323 [Proteus penneri ATCC 35198]
MKNSHNKLLLRFYAEYNFTSFAVKKFYDTGKNGVLFQVPF